MRPGLEVGSDEPTPLRCAQTPEHIHAPIGSPTHSLPIPLPSRGLGPLRRSATPRLRQLTTGTPEVAAVCPCPRPYPETVPRHRHPAPCPELQRERPSSHRSSCVSQLMAHLLPGVRGCSLGAGTSSTARSNYYGVSDRMFPLGRGVQLSELQEIRSMAVARPLPKLDTCGCHQPVTRNHHNSGLCSCRLRPETKLGSEPRRLFWFPQRGRLMVDTGPSAGSVAAKNWR